MEPSRDRPAVSVITATYNRARVLPDAIRSVFDQDVADFEHIIVDDGSQDGTLALIQRLLGERRLTYVRTPNRGQPAALNLGLAIARAPLVAFLDSDDEFKSDHLSRLCRELRAGRYDFLLARFELVVYSDDPDPKVTDFYNPEREISVREIECITGALFGRREVFLAVGGFRPVRFADTDLLERLKAAGYAWKRVSATTYRYHFGRCPDSLATSQSR